MKVPVKELENIAAAWLDEVLLPKSNPLQTAMIMFAFMQTKARVVAAAVPFMNADQNGLFDLEQVKDSARAALEKTGGSVVLPVINYRFDADDLDRLFEIAKRFAK